MENIFTEFDKAIGKFMESCDELIENLKKAEEQIKQIKEDIIVK